MARSPSLNRRHLPTATPVSASYSIRRHGALASAVHCAFDLLELDGRDLRREPIEKRKALLAKLLRGSHLSIVVNETFEEDGAIVFREVARLRGHRVEADWFALPFRPFASLAQSQKPEGAGSEAGSRGRLGFLALDKGQKIVSRKS